MPPGVLPSSPLLSWLHPHLEPPPFLLQEPGAWRTAPRPQTATATSSSRPAAAPGADECDDDGDDWGGAVSAQCRAGPGRALPYSSALMYAYIGLGGGGSVDGVGVVVSTAVKGELAGRCRAGGSRG